MPVPVPESEAPPPRYERVLATGVRAAGVQLAMMRTSAALVLFGLVQPATLVLVAHVATGGRGLADPGQVALGAGLLALWGSTVWASGQVLRQELWEGTLSQLLVRPVDVRLVVYSKSVTATLCNAAAASVSLTVAVWAIGWPVTIARPLPFAAAVVATLASASAFGFLLSSVFLLTRAAQRVAEALMYPVFILGGLLVPLELLPAAARPVAWLFSLYWGGRVLTAAARGEPAAPLDWLMLAGTAALAMVAGLWCFATLLARVRKEGSLEVI